MLHRVFFLAVLLTCMSLADQTRAACQYEVTAILSGPSCGVGGPFGVIALGLSETSEIVGYRPDCQTTTPRAIRWAAASGFQTIHNQIGWPGLATSELRGVNSAGAVTGNATLNGPSYSHAFVIPTPGAPAIEIPIPAGGLSTEARAINEAGQITGWWGTVLTDQGFIWDNGTFIDLTDTMQPSFQVRPLDINNAGDVVGWRTESSLGAQEAFLWSKGATIDIGVIPGGTTSQANGINEYGVVVGGGKVEISGSSLSRAFIWHAGEFVTVIEPPTGANTTAVTDINNRNVTVGASSCNPSGCVSRAIVHVDGQLFDLNDLLVDPFEGSLNSAHALNDAGQILCWARVGPIEAAVLLTPVIFTATDLNGDCQTDFTDLQILLSRWNTADPLADLDDDGAVGFHDLITMLIGWG